MRGAAAARWGNVINITSKIVRQIKFFLIIGPERFRRQRNVSNITSNIVRENEFLLAIGPERFRRQHNISNITLKIVRKNEFLSAIGTERFSILSLRMANFQSCRFAQITRGRGEGGGGQAKDGGEGRDGWE